MRKNLYHEEIKKQKRKIEVLSNIAIGLIVIAFLVAVWFTISLGGGIKAIEINECNSWKEQAENYPDYYLLEWQKQQCDRHGIEVNAPVIN